MRILHLSAVKNWGGGEKHIENLCLEMKNNYPEVTNFVLCRKGDLFEKSLQKQHIKHFTSPVVTNFDIRYALNLVSICRKEKIDLIHIHDPTALTFAVASDKFSSLPPFIFSKKTSFPIKDRKSTIYKYNYPKIGRILCVSEESKRVMSKSIADPLKLVTIIHGIRPEREKEVKPITKLRDDLGIPKGKKVIGNIANHTWPKSLDTFLEIAQRLIYLEGRNDLFFVQIGGFDRETSGLQQKLQEFKLEDHFRFYGFIPDASSYLPAFDVLALTSQSEGIPNVLYEAAYHKVPVVSTNVGGIPELVRHLENGLLADAFDVKKLAEHIVFLLKNKEIAEQFVEKAHNDLLKSFTTKRMAEKTLAEYKKVLHEQLY